MGPLMCSCLVDSFGKECLSSKKYLSKYKDLVNIPPLSMVDDVLAIAECGVDSVAVNSFLNTKTNQKKLQYGVGKCHVMHVGKPQNCCPDLRIDNWRLKKVQDSKLCGIKDMEDIIDGEHVMEKTMKYKYLGEIIDSTNKNTKNIAERKQKGIGAVNQICSILDEICFGPWYFEVLVILRNSLLVNSVLSCSETWYNVKEDELRQLVQEDEKLLLRALSAPGGLPGPPKISRNLLEWSD